MNGRSAVVVMGMCFAAGVAAGTGAPDLSGRLALFGGMILGVLALRYSPAAAFPSFFLIGVFSASLPPGGGPPGFATGACEALKGIVSSVPWPHGDTPGILTAFLTGDRSGLRTEVVDSFRSSGASHLLALSGLHLGVIYGIVSFLLRPLGYGLVGKRVRVCSIITVCGFYALMTGAGPSIVRAFLFIVIRELAGLSPGRRRDSGRTLFCALTVQLALSPGSISHLGFQLSYLAMCGIVFVYPYLCAIWPGELRGPLGWMWKSMAMSLSCQIFTAPLVWIRFHTFPVHFLLTNMIALPISSATIVLAVATVLFSAAGFCPPGLVRICDALVQALLFSLKTIGE